MAISKNFALFNLPAAGVTWTFKQDGFPVV